MTGLEKIIDKINADSAERCAQQAAAAEKKAREIIAAAQAQGDDIAAEIEANAQRQCDIIAEAAKSRADRLSRQALLSARVEAINDTLAKLRANLESMPSPEYFDAVISIAASNAMAGSCTARLNAADLARLPQGFESRLVQALGGKGAVCELSKQAADIDGGIILAYGDIEINCSFAAIIESRADELKEQIVGLIF